MTEPTEPRSYRLIRPLRDFLHAEAAGGVVLLAATVVALVWANSPWADAYDELWATQIAISVGDFTLSLDLRQWVNDGLMVIFFFVVGLEIKRELVVGELRDPRTVALPAFGALGGMVVPALIFVAFTAGTSGSEGWGIPMATDIAMAVGVMSLLGSRVSPSLKLFLLALAIVDDIGAIVVIAIFYGHGFDVGWGVTALAALAAVLASRTLGIQSVPAYVAIGLVAWLAVHESGIHATIAGVVLGLLTPTRPRRSEEYIDADELADVSTVDAALETTRIARDSVSVVEWLETRLHPWSSFVVVPLFALANAGIPIDADTLSEAASSAVTHGVMVGLVLGKPLGIVLFAWVACRAGLARLPAGANWSGLAGVAALGGIGFTVSLFIAVLAFPDGGLEDEAKIGILAASTLSAAIGATALLVRGASSSDTAG